MDSEDEDSWTFCVESLSDDECEELNNEETLETLQLLHEDESGALTLHVEQLEQILQQDELRGRRLVVISVVGAFRKGKSFLLNVMLNYLRAQGAEGWMKSSLTKGFPWRSGSNRETTGILVWPQVFTMKNNVAVLLMDTQGMFDDVSPFSEDSKIFTLTTLLSSVQIFNVTQQIQRDDLLNLQVFVELGRLLTQDCSSKPFQRLMFLVRDWPHLQDFSLGLEGGNKMLQAKWIQNSEQCKEKQKICNTLNECFDDVSCFLLNYPGRNIAEGLGIKNLERDADTDFIHYLKEFVQHVLQEENLPTKRVCNEEMTVENFSQFLCQVFQSLHQTDIPKPTALLECISDFANQQLIKRALDVYESYMNDGDSDIDILHEDAKERALALFINSPKLGGEAYAQPHREQLLEAITERFDVISKERLTLEVRILCDEYDTNMMSRITSDFESEVASLHALEVQDIISKLYSLRGYSNNDLQLAELNLTQVLTKKRQRFEIVKTAWTKAKQEKDVILNSMTEEGNWRYKMTLVMQHEHKIMGDRHYDVITLPDIHQVLPIKVGYAFFGPPQTPDGIGYEDQTMSVINQICVAVKEQALKHSENLIYYSIVKIHTTDLSFKTQKIETLIKVGVRGDPHVSVFIDYHQRVYSDWNDYIKCNKLPQCWLCAPKDGVFQVDENGNPQIIFEKSHSCSMQSYAAKFGQQIARGVKLGCLLVAGSSLIVTPTLPVLTATAIATSTSSAYSIVAGGATLTDRYKHKQSIKLTNKESIFAYIDCFTSLFALSSSTDFLYKINTTQTKTIWMKIKDYFITSPNQTMAVTEFLDIAENLSPELVTVLFDLAEVFKTMSNGTIPIEAILRIRAALLYYFHILVDAKSCMGQFGEQLAEMLINPTTFSLLPTSIVAVLHLTTCQNTQDVINHLSSRGVFLRAS